MARPSAFHPEYVEQARKLTELGATDRDVAAFFEVTEQTINNWKLRHPEFFESLKVGKDAADERVVQSLYRKATGYSHDAVKIFMPSGAEEPVYAPFVEHHAPDTTAMIFWLKNRRGAEWRDKQDFEHTGKDGGPIVTEDISDRDAAGRMLFLIAKARREQVTVN